MNRHPHGTPARYRGNRNTPGCRCTPCRKAAVRDEALCTLERLAGNPRRLPAAPVYAWVQELRAVGLSDTNILEAANLADETILCRLPNQRSVGRDKARAILAVPLDFWPTSDFVPAYRATRRVQALCTVGHSAGTIARRAETDRQRVTKLADGFQVQVNSALDAAIRRVYPVLLTEPGTCSRALAAARRHGWHGPDAWIDIDDPTEQPNAVLHLSARKQAEERLTDIVMLASAGNTPDQIAARTGLTRDYVRDRLKAECPTTLLALTA